MDHLAVARGHPIADAAGRLRDDDAVAAKGERPRNSKADNPCPDDQDVYDRLLSIEVPRIIEGIIV
jgi:hypothetical protein